MKLNSQKNRVIRYMEQNGSITPFEAFEHLGITKLATVISELILKDGFEIEKYWVESENRFGEKSRFRSYSLGAKEYES